MFSEYSVSLLNARLKEMEKKRFKKAFLEGLIKYIKGLRFRHFLEEFK